MILPEPMSASLLRQRETPPADAGHNPAVRSIRSAGYGVWTEPKMPAAGRGRKEKRQTWQDSTGGKIRWTDVKCTSIWDRRKTAQNGMRTSGLHRRLSSESAENSRENLGNDGKIERVLTEVNMTASSPESSWVIPASCWEPSRRQSQEPHTDSVPAVRL